MNAGLPETHPSIRYYDSDYPAPDSDVPENFDAVTALQGLRDVERYLEIAEETGGPVLELGCGTGRIGLVLARAGHEVVGVDLSPAMLARFESRLAGEPARVRSRVTLVNQDVTALDLPGRDFPLAIAPFNGLLCIPDFDGQRRAIARAADHLAPGSLLVIDAVNPLVLSVAGDPAPTPFFTRREVTTGNLYTRFAARGPMGEDQVQELFGWYDEIAETGAVRRTPYSMRWRPVFRYELELMLETAGLVVESVEGGHEREPFTAASPKLFVIARLAAPGVAAAAADRSSP